MSANELRQAAATLRERAEAATPGPWSAADEHGLMPEADAAWCVSQMRPGYQSMSETEGYVGDVAEVWCERKDACPDAEWIATMHPEVGLALADWLGLVASTPNFDAWLGSALRGPTADGARTALRIARLINGGAS